MKNQFLSDILREDAESHRSPNFDVWPAVRVKLMSAGQTSRHKQPRWLGHVRIRGVSAPRAAAICLAAAVAVVALASLAWLLFPGAQSVSATQIMARANQAAQDPGAFGVRSLEGIAVFRYAGKNDDQEFAQRETHVWVLAPDKRRWEDRSLTADMRMVFVSDGTVSWSYNPQENTVRVGTHTYVGGIDALYTPERAFGASDLDELLQHAQEGYDVELLGSDQVAGRPAHVLKVTPKMEGLLRFGEGSPRTLWIDQETYLLLGYALKNLRFNFSASWSYTSLQLNVDVDPALFAYNPPAGAEIIEEESGGPTGRLMREQWEQLASRVPFALFRFEALYDSFVSVGGPAQDSENPNRIVERFRWLPDKQYTLTLIEEPGPLPESAKRGMRIQRGPFVGYMRMEGEVKRLTWEQEGTVITLVGRQGIAAEIMVEIQPQLGRVRVPPTPAPQN